MSTKVTRERVESPAADRKPDAPQAAAPKVRLGDSMSPWVDAPKVRLGDSMMPW